MSSRVGEQNSHCKLCVIKIGKVRNSSYSISSKPSFSPTRPYTNSPGTYEVWTSCFHSLPAILACWQPLCHCFTIWTMVHHSPAILLQAIKRKAKFLKGKRCVLTTIVLPLIDIPPVFPELPMLRQPMFSPSQNPNQVFTFLKLSWPVLCRNAINLMKMNPTGLSAIHTTSELWKISRETKARIQLNL